MIDTHQWRNLERHPMSELCGDMTEAEFESLRADIRSGGFDDKMRITIYEDKVLDGWHRQRACVMEHKQPVYDTYTGDDPLGFVIRRNLTRRHWDTSQRGLVAGRLATYGRGGDRKSATFAERNGGNQREKSSFDRTIQQAADELNVSTFTAKAGKKVAENGVPALQEAVMKKVVSLSVAAKMAKEPEAVQNAAVTAVKEGKVKTAREAVEKQNPPIHDELDEEVPESLRPVFERAADFREIVNQLNAVNRKLTALKETPAGACMRLQQAQVDLRNLKETVRFDAPYAVCPACKGDGKKRKANCPCKGRGWLVETAFKNLPQEYRQ